MKKMISASGCWKTYQFQDPAGLVLDDRAQVQRAGQQDHADGADRMSGIS